MKLKNLKLSFVITIFSLFSLVSCGGCGSSPEKPQRKGRPQTTKPTAAKPTTSLKKVIVLFHGLNALEIQV